MDALIGLAGALVGGTLVLLGDALARRSARREGRLEQLRLATSDVLASYLVARANLIAFHKQGRAVDVEDVWPRNRYLAYARLYTLPGSERLSASLREVRDTSLALFEARHDEDITAQLAAQLASIEKLEDDMKSLQR